MRIIAAVTTPAASTRRRLLQTVGAGAVGALIAGRLAAPASAQAPFPTRIRVLHASPPLGKVEVLFNGEKKLDEFEYGTTSDWIEVKPGVVRVIVRRDRAGINYPVFDAIAPVVANEDYDLILSDPLVIPAPVDRSPLPADRARVRFIHASVDLPAIDIAVKGGDVLAANLEYGQLSDPIEVPAGNHDLEARLHGTGDVALDMPGIVATPETVHHLVLYGLPGEGNAPLSVANLSDQARTPMPAATPSA